MFIKGISNVCVYCSVSIGCLTSNEPQENESLSGREENWLEIKKSSIKNGGFGVFA
jgi:hypothetical protein